MNKLLLALLGIVLLEVIYIGLADGPRRELAWHVASWQGDLDSMARYLDRHPAGRHADAAAEILRPHREMRRYVEEATRLAGQDKYTEAMEQVKLALHLKSDDAAAMALRQQIEAKLVLASEVALDLGTGVTLKLVLIPAGKFMMGSPGSEQGRDNDEAQHEVTFSRAFYMGVTEVTQEQYEAVMGSNPSHFKGPRNPVETVSWNDAMEFCRKASQKTGRSVRLPTEAEWEYACRAGSTTAFCFGNNQAELDGYAWISSNSKQRSWPVAQKKPNAWGLYDMHGNVWEWCADWFGAYPSGRVTDPKGPGSGSSRVLRGGSWSHIPLLCRSAYRSGVGPAYRNGSFGFRVALDFR